MIKLRYPTKYVSITTYFSNSHKAIDIASGVKYNGKLEDNKSVYTIADCVITNTGWAKDYGYYVIYKVLNTDKDIYVHDGHFDSPVELVMGTICKANTFIHKMGSSGTSVGVHDHHILEIGGTRVDPTLYEYIYPDQFKGDLETKELMYYTPEESDPKTEDNVPNTDSDVPNSDSDVPSDDIKFDDYVVKRGDTLSSIAKKYNTTWQEIYEDNKDVIGSNPNMIYPNQILRIRVDYNIINYVVKSGDTLSSIAKKYGTTWQKIYEDNKSTIKDPNLIYPNQIIKIKL